MHYKFNIISDKNSGTFFYKIFLNLTNKVNRNISEFIRQIKFYFKRFFKTCIY